MPRNKYCQFSDLSNEASVEQFFVNRLLADLGYEDRHIKPKTSLQELTINFGRRQLLYRPDYALEARRKIRCIVDAKAVTEPLDPFVGQCASYCLALNQQYRNENPVQYFLLTNGNATRVYLWDSAEPLLELRFGDFRDGNAKFARLQELLGRDALMRRPEPEERPATHKLKRKSISEVNADFAWCHQFIHKKDNLSQSAAFMEFVKIVFLKLTSDKEIHTRHPELAGLDEFELPESEVRFSTRWIEQRQEDHPNPLDALQFQSMLTAMENRIQRGLMKRIFKAGEHIQLTPETIKGVVGRLEAGDLHGIDADLNGRLFETFLNATMRGKDLGQFFTPRSVVKLATRLARVRVDREHTDTVLDACCGTGGFLIDVFADMLAKVASNQSLTAAERLQQRDLIANHRVYGIDIAVDPPLARIARMNMYLHGDGGSSIFIADSLDKSIADIATDSPELRLEKAELRTIMAGGNFADVVITNPPFAKEYKRSFTRDAEILDHYDLGYNTIGGRRIPRALLKSSAMFFERYYDLLKPGGRLITVIDDSILGGDRYGDVRDYIRSRYIVRAVVSLPGDAFQRSKARVKTSLLVLQKKNAPTDEQPPVFMNYCTVVGLDDPARQRVLAIDEINRELAAEEIARLGALYDAFLAGRSEANDWIVPASAIADRMDVKSCLPKPGRLTSDWERAGVAVTSLTDWVSLVFAEDDEGLDNPDVIVAAESDELVTFVRVQYNGFAESGEEIYASEGSSSRLYRVRANDIVISHINAVHGAVAVIPPELDGAVVTSEFTVCRALPGIDPRIVWMLLRSPEARADLLLLATGIGRSRVRWANAVSLQLPQPQEAAVQSVTDDLREAERLEGLAKSLRAKAEHDLNDPLGLDNADARTLLAAFKPPK